jgi:hypothetical protein
MMRGIQVGSMVSTPNPLPPHHLKQKNMRCAIREDLQTRSKYLHFSRGVDKERFFDDGRCILRRHRTV